MSAGTDKKIRVVIADDHPMVRATIALNCAVHPDIDVVGQAGTGPEAVELCERLAADVLILDLMLPELDGFEVAAELKRKDLPTRILVLTARDDPDAMFEAIRLSLGGYLDKTSDISTLTEAIVAVARGERLFTEQQTSIAMAAFGDSLKRSREASRASLSLTARERDVLTLIGEGLSTKQIASRLSVSRNTIESHIYRLYRKLGVKTRVEAFSRGVDLGLIKGSKPGPSIT